MFQIVQENPVSYKNANTSELENTLKKMQDGQSCLVPNERIKEGYVRRLVSIFSKEHKVKFLVQSMKNEEACKIFRLHSIGTSAKPLKEEKPQFNENQIRFIHAAIKLGYDNTYILRTLRKEGFKKDGVEADIEAYRTPESPKPRDETIRNSRFANQNKDLDDEDDDE